MCHSFPCVLLLSISLLYIFNWLSLLSTLLFCIVRFTAVKRVGNFLSQIPHQLQARASLRCGAFARSLLQWELAYDEDAAAQKLAYNTGVALVRRSAVSRLTEFVNPQSNSVNSSGEQQGTIGPVALTSLSGLMNTYACLRDSDGRSSFVWFMLREVGEILYSFAKLFSISHKSMECSPQKLCWLVILFMKAK